MGWNCGGRQKAHGSELLNRVPESYLTLKVTSVVIGGSYGT